ncbi:hypothetical protein XENOCAPTIV_019052 [Xenoophorus captivus]|uniref:Uncharacterized protein n=1 Tax=Xenoophorus captivus TaxID=1517983 RepID=A0ABV0RRF7_9TELE
MQQVPNAIPKVIRRTGGANSLELERENFERGQVGGSTDTGVGSGAERVGSVDGCMEQIPSGSRFMYNGALELIWCF